MRVVQILELGLDGEKRNGTGRSLHVVEAAKKKERQTEATSVYGLK